MISYLSKQALLSYSFRSLLCYMEYKSTPQRQCDERLESAERLSPTRQTLDLNEHFHPVVSSL